MSKEKVDHIDSFLLILVKNYKHHHYYYILQLTIKQN